MFDSLSPAGQKDMLAILQAYQADNDGKKVSRGNNKEARKKKKTKGNSNVAVLSRSSCTGTDKNRKANTSPVRKLPGGRLVINEPSTTPKGTKRISMNPIKPQFQSIKFSRKKVMRLLNHQRKNRREMQRKIW